MHYSDEINNIVDRFINWRLEKISPMDADAYFSARQTRIGDPNGQFITDNMNRIHGNIAALLTHISAMIAALGIILIVFEDSKITQFFIFLEILAYTIFAIICVYCLRYRGPKPIEEDGIDGDYIYFYYRAYLNRRYIYHISSNGVLLTTLFFFVTIFLHAVALVF